MEICKGTSNHIHLSDGYSDINNEVNWTIKRYLKERAKLEKHKAKIIQQIYAIRYYFGYGQQSYWDSRAGVNQREEYMSDSVIWEGELDSPVLKEDEQLRIESLNKTHQINSVVRSTEGGYIYIVKEKALIDDEKTKSTEEDALQREKEYKERAKTDVEDKVSWWKKIFG